MSLCSFYSMNRTLIPAIAPDLNAVKREQGVISIIVRRDLAGYLIGDSLVFDFLYIEILDIDNRSRATASPGVPSARASAADNQQVEVTITVLYGVVLRYTRIVSQFYQLRFRHVSHHHPSFHISPPPFR